MTNSIAMSLGVLILLVPSVGQEVPKWQATTVELIQREKPGYGKLCGVVVDPTSGDLIVNLSDKGLYRSSDRGKTWQRLSAKAVPGRTEWPGCLMLDPTAKSQKLVVALVYGAPIMVSADAGKTWKMVDVKSSHIDWCAVDWTDPDMKFILALKHESGGLLLVSRDGGQSFDDVGKGYGPAWIFDRQTAVVAQAPGKAKREQGLFRTTDAGRTFTPCSAYTTKALPRWKDGVLYWLVDGALLTTRDKGETWQKRCDLKDGRFGPVFGKTASHLFVLTGGGIVESKDGGVSWTTPLPLPAGLKGQSPLTWIAFDPIHDVIYVMKMGSELFKLER